jgi:Spy/CpxP family protein refolding chaperone
VSEINIGRLKEILPELSALYEQKQAYAEQYKAGIDAAVHETGATKKALGKLIVALKADKAEDAKAEADELSELLDALA